MTQWRVGALRICTLLRERGWVTRADFKAAGIDAGRWVGPWLVPDGKDGRLTRYVAKPDAALPDLGWEAERDAIAAKDGVA